MLILGIETSCDETSVALVRDGREVLANLISSSKQAFELLAGVIPEEAAREQVKCMIPLLRQTLKEAGVHPSDIDAIGVTRGPGLLGSLLIGTMTARVLARAWGKPLVGVHHTLGHLSSPWLVASGRKPEPIAFPILTLSVSGGHTDIWHRTSHVKGELLGSTRDDAAGEAFDKGAHIMGLPYPGGPSIAKAADGGSEDAYDFPHMLRGDHSLDFSFSGLKTSLKYLLRDHPEVRSRIPDVAASYQHAICRHLTERLSMALQARQDIREVHLVGGVSANLHLRSLAQECCDQRRVNLRYPQAIAYCTDNAAMIASAAYFVTLEHPSLCTEEFITSASLPLAATFPL